MKCHTYYYIVFMSQIIELKMVQKAYIFILRICIGLKCFPARTTLAEIIFKSSNNFYKFTLNFSEVLEDLKKVY